MDRPLLRCAALAAALATSIPTTAESASPALAAAAAARLPPPPTTAIATTATQPTATAASTADASPAIRTAGAASGLTTAHGPNASVLAAFAPSLSSTAVEVWRARRQVGRRNAGRASPARVSSQGRAVTCVTQQAGRPHDVGSCDPASISVKTVFRVYRLSATLS